MCIEREIAPTGNCEKDFKIISGAHADVCVCACVHVHMCAWMFSKILNGEYVYYVEQLK